MILTNVCFKLYPADRLWLWIQTRLRSKVRNFSHGTTSNFMLSWLFWWRNGGNGVHLLLYRRILTFAIRNQVKQSQNCLALR